MSGPPSGRIATDQSGMNENEASDSDTPPWLAIHPDDAHLSQEEFLKLLEDPVNRKSYQNWLQNIIDGGLPGTPPEAIESARRALAKLHERCALGIVTGKFSALVAVMKRPGGTMVAEERLKQCNTLLDEITDDMLDMPEPHRTTFLKRLLPIREQIRAIRIED
jgi:hypothetical protein